MRILVSIAFLLIAAAALTACEGWKGTMSYAKDDEIAGQTRREIHELNNMLLQSILDDDPTVLRGLLDEEVTREKSFQHFDEIFANLRDWFTAAELELFHEFDVTFSRIGRTPWTLATGREGGLLYQVRASGERLYVSLLIARGGFEDMLIGVEYVRRGETWRLLEIGIGLFAVDGHSAIGWYENARALYEERLVIPAAVRLLVTRNLLRPLPSVRYAREQEVMDLDVEIRTRMRSDFDFPVELSGLSSAPRVHELKPVFLDQKFAIGVHYVSTLAFDEPALRNEMRAMLPELTKQFPGLCRDIGRLQLTAHAELPDGSEDAAVALDAIEECR